MLPTYAPSMVAGDIDCDLEIGGYSEDELLRYAFKMVDGHLTEPPWQVVEDEQEPILAVDTEDIKIL